MAAGVVAPQRAQDPPARRRTRTKTTPSWLRLSSAVLAAVGVAAAILSVVAVLDRQSATTSARSRAEPLLLASQSVITSLSDADTTAAGSLLAGRTPPAAARVRYADDLAQASAAVVASAGLAGSGSGAAEIRSLAVGIPVYAGLVETAVADQRQGFPLAGSYLGEASGFLRASLLPPASAVYRSAQRELSADRSAATRLALVLVATVASVLLLVGLLWLQWSYTRRFRRLLNVPSLVATAATVAVLAWSATALGVQAHHIRRAGQEGSAPLTRYTQVRILALQARADDELTLVTRDSVPSYQSDFAAVVAQIDALLGPAGGPLIQQATLAAARRAWVGYLASHVSVRAADSGGDLAAAIALASGSGTGDLPAASGALDGVLRGGVSVAQTVSSRELGAAASDVDYLAAGLAVLAVAAAGLILLGAQRRIAEYR